MPSDLSGLPQYIQANGKPVKWAYRKSLGTHDESEAKRRALDVLRQLEERWAIERRRANPIKLSELPPDVLKQMADYIHFCVFSADDYRRDSPQLAHRLAALRDLAAKKLIKEQAEAAFEVPAGAYHDDHSAGGLETLNLERDAQAGKAVARRNHEAILNDAQAAAQTAGAFCLTTATGLQTVVPVQPSDALLQQSGRRSSSKST